MSSRWQWLLRQFSRRLWVRVSLFSVLAIATALVAMVIAPYLPADLSANVGADAVGTILGVIASSMLAVTIFSLSTMVTAYIAANSNVTPRAIRLLVEDTTAHNALGTFVGAFLFSLVGIIALNTGLYAVQGRLVLFVATLTVIALVVMTLLRWIDHVATLGQVADTTQRIEKAARAAMRERRDRPWLGGTPRDHDAAPPDGATPVLAERIGYVQHVDTSALAELTDAHHGSSIHVAVLPGTFVDPSRVLAWTVGIPADAMEELRTAFTVDELRTFDQDPRFGLIVLAEIASRALSTSTNDPGTAIDVLGRGVRVMAICAEPRTGDDDAPRHPAVHVPGLDPADLFDDLFGPIGRDGAGMLEVGLRMQKSLLALARLGDARYVAHARRHSRLALERGLAALHIEADRQRLRAMAAQVEAVPLDGG